MTKIPDPLAPGSDENICTVEEVGELLRRAEIIDRHEKRNRRQKYEKQIIGRKDPGGPAKIKAAEAIGNGGQAVFDL